MPSLCQVQRCPAFGSPAFCAVRWLRISLCWIFISTSRSFAGCEDPVHCIAILIVEIDHQDILSCRLFEGRYDSLQRFGKLRLLLIQPYRILNLLFQNLQIILLFAHLIHHSYSRRLVVASVHLIYLLSYSAHD